MAAKKEWVVVNDGASLLARLIDAHHGNLKDCAVMIVAAPKTGTKDGRLVLARSAKASDLVRAVLAPHGELADYIVKVGQDTWPLMPEGLRERTLDKALCYFAGKDPETGKLLMRYPDVSGEFTEIVSRYGLPENDPEMQKFIKVGAKQMKLDFSEKPPAA